jgi:predicted O-methyltransferase YrrM
MARIINKILNRFNLEVKWTFPRPSIKFIKKFINGKKLIGAEIGTWKGINAKIILKTINIEKLYLIDPYNPLIHDVGEKEARKRLKGYNDKLIWIKKLSNDAVNDVPNNLDFVYIDGDHSYKGVKQDLENYYPKIRKGGVLAGHDINLGGHLINIRPELKYTEGVAQAVMEFAAQKKLEIFIYGNDWWCIKR